MDRKPVFDAIRAILGRGFRPHEIAAIDRALDRASGQARMLRSVGPAGLALIKNFEGCARPCGEDAFAAYPDPGTGGAPWTIGWGATGAEIGPGTVWTQSQCDARLARDLARFAAEVVAALRDAPTTQEQFDALVSFHYNTGAIGRATLTRLHNTGNHSGARAEFGKWINGGGRVLRGLIERRAAEAALYASG